MAATRIAGGAVNADDPAVEAARAAMVACLQRAENLDSQLWACSWLGGEVQGRAEHAGQVVFWQTLAIVALGGCLVLCLALAVLAVWCQRRYRLLHDW